MPAAELGGPAFAAQQFLHHLALELLTVNPQISHGFSLKVQPEGKVLSLSPIILRDPAKLS